MGNSMRNEKIQSQGEEKHNNDQVLDVRHLFHVKCGGSLSFVYAHTHSYAHTVYLQ